MSKEDLLFEISDHIGWVTFNRPGSPSTARTSATP
jgi:hypothetical protein